MLYSVSEIAEILGITKQGVYNKIKRFSSELKQFKQQKQGVTYLTDEGLEILKKDMDIETSETIENKETTNYGLKEEYINSLKDQIGQLKSQVGHLEEQIQVKDDQLQNKDKLLENFQVLLKQNQDRILLLEGEVAVVKESEVAAAKEEKKGFWTRLFGR